MAAKRRTNSKPTKISLDELNRMAVAGSDESRMRPFVVVDESNSTPFAPLVKPDARRVEIAQTFAKSAAALDWANRLSRATRRRRFDEKLARGYRGIRIASEGDSWFQFPILVKDTIDHLMNDFAVLSVDAAGDTLENIHARGEFLTAIDTADADVFLLSAGGNDVLGGGNLARFLRAFDATRTPADHIVDEFETELDRVNELVRSIVVRASAVRSTLQIILHGYDRPIPQKNGRWLGRPMISKDITAPALQFAIAGELIDRFNSRLATLAGEFENVHHLDLRGVVGGSASKDWYDELHPNDRSFGLIARRFAAKIDEVAVRSRGGKRTPAAPRVQSNRKSSRGTEPAIAVHVGLNRVNPADYAGWPGTLAACANDARAMRAITTKLKYRNEILLDANATRAAVIDSITSAADRLQPGGIFALSYSGHGSQVPDIDGDEIDRLDETWCLFDGQLIDDELATLWPLFPAGSRVLLFSDSCHSGTVFRATPIDFDPTPNRLMPTSVRERVNGQTRNRFTTRTRTTTANLRCTVRSISACQDNQLAADGPVNGRFTAALLKVWNGGRFAGDYTAFVRAIMRRMPESQTPQHRVDGVANPEFDRQRPFAV